jgi:hypothetical protein
MAASETTIANLALSKLGAGKIIDLNEESPEAQACRLHYAETRDEVLRCHRWNFAIKPESLVEVPGTPSFGWSHQFALPSDSLRILEVNGWKISQRPGYWSIEGRMLLCNDAVADVRYIQRITDCNLFDAIFVEALVLKLGSKIARAINGSIEMSNSLLQEYVKLTGGWARRIDAVESNPIRRPAWQNSDLVTARFVDA